MGVASAVFGLLVGCGNSGKAGGGTAGTGGTSFVDSSSPASGGGSPSSGSGGDLGSSSTTGAGGLVGSATSRAGSTTTGASGLAGSATSSGGSTASTAGRGGTGGLGGSGGRGGSTPGHAFTHPGAPLTLSDLQTLKANVDQGKEPWKSAYALLAADGKSKPTYVMAGPFENVSRSPNVNLNQWRSDMVAIWNLARMWFFTGTDTYAKRAHDILFAWATTQTSFTGSESMLDLGDYAYALVGGADILRGDKVPRDPKDWQFQGSNDGAAWTTLDTQTNQTFTERYQVKSYDIASPASYRTYRLTITANNGDGSFADLAELGLWTS